MKDQFFFGQNERQIDDTEAFAILGIAGVAMVCFAVSTMLDFVAGRDQVATGLPSKSAAVAQSETVASRAPTNAVEQRGRAVDPAPCPTTNTAGVSSTAALKVRCGGQSWVSIRRWFFSDRCQPSE